MLEYDMMTFPLESYTEGKEGCKVGVIEEGAEYDGYSYTLKIKMDPGCEDTSYSMEIIMILEDGILD